MAPTTKPGRKRKPVKCRWCKGSGSVVIGRDERGRPQSTSCNRCGGAGEL